MYLCMLTSNSQNFKFATHEMGIVYGVQIN